MAVSSWCCLRPCATATAVPKRGPRLRQAGPRGPYARDGHHDCTGALPLGSAAGCLGNRARLAMDVRAERARGGAATRRATTSSAARPTRQPCVVPVRAQLSLPSPISAPAWALHPPLASLGARGAAGPAQRRLSAASDSFAPSSFCRAFRVTRPQAVADKDLPELSDELKKMLTDLFNELDRDGEAGSRPFASSRRLCSSRPVATALGAWNGILWHSTHVYCLTVGVVWRTAALRFGCAGNGSLDAEEFVILGRAIGWDKTSRSVAQSQINKADKVCLRAWLAGKWSWFRVASASWWYSKGHNRFSDGKAM